MNQEAQKVAVPFYLRKKLLCFRSGKGDEQKYFVRDEVLGKTHYFEPWQFFVLEVLPVCNDFPKLASVFEDRFGHAITIEEVEELFALVADKNLFGPEWTSHPLLAEFDKKYQQWTTPALKNAESGSKPEESKQAVADEELPEGLRDAISSDDIRYKKGWDLFNPTRVLKRIHPLLLPFRYVIYLLPVLGIAAFVIIGRYFDIMIEDFRRFLIGPQYSHFTYLAHTLIGMFTDNLLATLVSALVGYSYLATVDSFYIQLHFGFYPRFHVRVSNTEKLSRRERIWLYGAPLLARIGLICLCIVLWFGTRTRDDFLSTLALTVGVIATTSLYLAANPFIKSSGYYLLTTVLNEPQLRTKAALAVVNKLRGNVYQKLDNNVLVAYALVSSLFMIATFTVFVLMFGSYVKFHLGGAGVFLTVVIIFLLILRLIDKIRKVGEVYERSIQFERWRKIALPKVENDLVKTGKKGAATYLKWSIILVILVGLIAPYHYEPGGNFVILANQKQEITSDITGIVDEVYFDGGEFLKKGAVIAKLDCTDYLAQMKIYTAKVQEQQSVVNDLKSRPKPEEIKLAENALEIEMTRAQFSKEKLDRLEKLFKEKTISFEELDDKRREHNVNLNQVEEKRANLKLVKAGVTHDVIAAAEAKLQSYKEERDWYQEKIDQSALYMPFDGTLAGINLKQKKGHYLNKGEVFALAENTAYTLAEIEVPEPDVGYIVESATVRIRPFSYSSEDFSGVVTAIDVNVTEKITGKVVKVNTLINNKDGRLKAGMTGYGKISGQKLQGWEVLTLAIIRFFKVEVWSWIP